jgi:hypothetical protein
MSEHKNADGQAGQDVARTPPIISAVDAAMVEAENLHPQLRRSDCERLIKAALEVYYREPSQEGHAAEPACSAPDEALIEEIIGEAYLHWSSEIIDFRNAVGWAIREYIRLSAGKEKG